MPAPRLHVKTFSEPSYRFVALYYEFKLSSLYRPWFKMSLVENWNGFLPLQEVFTNTSGGMDAWKIGRG